MGHHTLEYPVDAVNKVKRHNERGNYALETIHSLINNAQILHISFTNPSSPFPVTLPMIGQMGSFDRPSADVGDPLDLYLHGYVSSRIMNLGRGASGEGMPVCVAASYIDGLVLALSAFSHSYNYRSALLFGHATLVEDEAEKLYAMEIITNKVVPERWRHTRLPPTKAEIQSTGVLKVKIASGSAKFRNGQAGDEKYDMENEDALNSFWTGVVPMYQTMGEPLPSSYNRVDLPSHVSEYVKEFNEDNQDHAFDAARK